MRHLSDRMLARADGWEGFTRALNGSPLERRFALALAVAVDDLEPVDDGGSAIARMGPGIVVHFQHPACGWHLDYAFTAPRAPLLRLGVELDGEGGHGGWRQAERDRQRDRDLLLGGGWSVMRFTGREILGTPLTSVLQVVRIVRRRIEVLGPGLAKAVAREQMPLRFASGG